MIACCWVMQSGAEGRGGAFSQRENKGESGIRLCRCRLLLYYTAGLVRETDEPGGVCHRGGLAVEVFSSEDAKESPRAFQEKRPPRLLGR